MAKFHSSAYVLVATTINKRITREAAGLSHSNAAAARIDMLEAVAGDLADAFEADNERFDRDRFLKACGAA